MKINAGMGFKGYKDNFSALDGFTIKTKKRFMTFAINLRRIAIINIGELAIDTVIDKGIDTGLNS